MICGQIIGRGIRHACSCRYQLTARQARVDRGRSLDRLTKNRRKRNLSLLVGREEEKVQEQIISEAFNRIAERKGERFRINLIKGSGKGGLSKEYSVPRNKKVST